MFGKATKLGLCRLKPATKFQIAAVFLRQEVGDWPLNHAVAMFGQSHIGNHLGLEQADGVARDAIAETGVEFLGNSSTTNHIARLDNPHLEARPRKVKSAH